MLLLFARGSEEPENMGANVGIPLAKAFSQQLGAGNVAVQGVYKYGPWVYPAILSESYQGGSQSGAEAMAHLVGKWKSSCPGTKIILGGYSQGAQVCLLLHLIVPSLQQRSVLDRSVLTKHLLPSTR